MESLGKYVVDKRVAHVACGFRHTAVLDRNGKVFTFGDDRKIQLGLGDTRSTDDRDMRTVSTGGKPRDPSEQVTESDREGSAGKANEDFMKSTANSFREGSAEDKFDERGVKLISRVVQYGAVEKHQTMRPTRAMLPPSVFAPTL